MKSKVSAASLLAAAQWAYDQATGDIPLIGSSRDLAKDYMQDAQPRDRQIDSLIRWQCSKGFCSGFATGLPGILAAPAVIPASIAASFFIQLRMVSAIAYMRGYDIKADEVRTMSLLCLCGSDAADLADDFGVKFSKKVAVNVFMQINGLVLAQVNKAIGTRLFAKFSETGFISFGKAVPILGAVVGGCFDGMATMGIGNAAKKIFVPLEPVPTWNLIIPEKDDKAMSVFGKVTDLLGKPVEIALNTVARPFLNKAITGYGEILTMKIENKTLKATLVLAGLEDKEIEVECSDVRIAQDGSSISLHDYRSNMPFAEKALNRFATDEYKVETPAVRTALVLIRKAFV